VSRGPAQQRFPAVVVVCQTSSSRLLCCMGARKRPAPWTCTPACAQQTPGGGSCLTCAGCQNVL
jgi:hypothetical protein